VQELALPEASSPPAIPLRFILLPKTAKVKNAGNLARVGVGCGRDAILLFDGDHFIEAALVALQT